MRRNGMTLIEILVAIAIVAILLGVGVYVGKGVYEQAKERALESTFVILESALDEYKEYKGEFPVAAGINEWERNEYLYEQLNSLPVSRKMLEKLNASLIRNDVPDVNNTPEIYDPWDKVLDYLYDPAVHNYPEIESSGPDKDFGTPADNISNKEK